MDKNTETSCKNNVKCHLRENMDIKDFLFLQSYLPTVADSDQTQTHDKTIKTTIK